MTGINSRALNVRLWLLWIRHAYRFRWAHRPLCSRFSDGVLRIGQVHLCRSCVCAYGGIVVGALACLFLNAVRESAVPLLVCLMIPTLAFSMPQLYRRCSRRVRDLLRFSMGCCIALCLCVMLMGKLIVSALCAGILLVFWRIYFVMRRNRRAQACNACPELGGICTGCRIQADAVRAYEAEATSLLLASGKKPNVSEYAGQ
jgi:uncharacterized membrane protein